MMKIRLSALTFIILAIFSTNLFAQTNPVQITGGRIFVFGDRQLSGSVELKSEIFNSIGSIKNSGTFPWTDICRELDCKPGKEFYSSGTFDFYDLQNRGDFTINGAKYNAYYSNQLHFSRQAIVIPRIARKKGLMFFTIPFEMNGKMSVCQVNDFEKGCPSDKVLFNENVQGHGTLRIILRINFKFFVKLETFLTLENFEYQFEP